MVICLNKGLLIANTDTMLPGYHRGEAVTSRSLKCDKLSTKYGYVHPCGTYRGPPCPPRRDLYVVEFAVIIASLRLGYYDYDVILVSKCVFVSLKNFLLSKADLDLRFN